MTTEVLKDQQAGEHWKSLGQTCKKATQRLGSQFHSSDGEGRIFVKKLEWTFAYVVNPAQELTMATASRGNESYGFQQDGEGRIVATSNLTTRFLEVQLHNFVLNAAYKAAASDEAARESVEPNE